MPTPGNVHHDVLLTNLSIGWLQDPSYYIAGQVFPLLGVDRQSNKFRVFNKGEWFRNDVTVRGPGDEAKATDWTLSESPYFCQVKAVRQFLDEQTIANFDAPGDIYQSTTQFLTNQILLDREMQFAADFLHTGVWGLDKAGVASAPTGNQFVQWNDYTNSNPVVDIEVGKTAVAQTTGFEANTLVLGRDVLSTLRNHPDIIDRINYTGNGGRTGADAAVLAGVFGVDRVLVAKAIKNTAAEGQSPTFSKVAAAKQAFLAYAPAAAGLNQPQAGLTFSWSNLPGGAPGSLMAVKRYRNEDRASDVIEVQTAYSNQVIANELGVFYDTVIA